MCRSRRYALVFALLAAALFALFALNLCIGSVAVPLGDVWAALVGGADAASGDAAASLNADIVWTIRLPRAIAVVLLGGALALSGFLLQTFFNNPIAGPYILGISSGAKLVVALVMVVFVGSATAMGSWMLVGAAFAGSMMAMLFVLLVSRRIDSQAMLIVAGVMVGYICSAVTDFLVTFASDQNIVNLRNWSLGSFSGIAWDDVWVMAVVVVLASVAAFLLSKPMGAFQLGEAYAQSMGVNVRAFRVALVVLSSLLAACVTAFAGPISFVGIAVPHLVKRFLGTSRPLVVVPAAFLGGGVFCLFCDLIARSVFAPTEVSVSAVTALFGAPVVIAILVRRQASRGRGGVAAREEERHGGDEAGAAMPGAARTIPQTPQTPPLQVRGLAVGYGGQAVLSGIDFQAQGGRILTLIGPNGAGKSTILKTLSGQIAPVAGKVELDGRGLASLSFSERARTMAVVLTERVSTELLTCADVVEAGRYPYTGRLGLLTERDRERVRVAMSLMNVGHLAECDFMQISDGQRQRVLIARAIAQEPRVLLLDEPTSFLDIRYQIELLRVLRRLAHEQGVAIVASLHELNLARIVSDEVLCVKDAGVFAQGAPAAVFTPEVIDALYDLTSGTFDPATGEVHLEGEGDPAAGKPHGIDADREGKGA